MSLAAPGRTATIDFDIDQAASSVTRTDTGGVCILSRCGASASLALRLDTGDTHALGTGGTARFGSLSFTGRGTAIDSFDVVATLAFSSPAVSASGAGAGGAILLLGFSKAGTLSWSSYAIEGAEAFGASDVAFLFGGDTGLFLGRNITTDASMAGRSVLSVVVPVPTAGFLLLAALGGLGAV